MRLHVVGLPHTKVHADFCGCAYTNKLRLFVKMMKERHELFVYAPEGPTLKGATLIPCLPETERIKTFGADDKNRLPSWPKDHQSRQFNLNAAAAILSNAQPHDLILLSGGLTHNLIADALQSHLICEPFVGYTGVLGGNSHAAYESYFHMAQVAVMRGFHDIRWYDRVVQPFVDAEEFPDINVGRGKYLLFLGRLISRKGPHIALQIAKAVGLPLYVAGAGGRMEGATLVGQDVRLEGDLKYFGPVGIGKRAQLMADARAVIMPTTYVEPGGNVAIEAMMTGTPVIAPDCGVFSETVRHGVSGFHFRTLKQAVAAVSSASRLNPQSVRAYAKKNYSLEAIAPKFDQWFDDLQQLWGEGWNSV